MFVVCLVLWSSNHDNAQPPVPFSSAKSASCATKARSRVSRSTKRLFTYRERASRNIFDTFICFSCGRTCVHAVESKFDVRIQTGPTSCRPQRVPLLDGDRSRYEKRLSDKPIVPSTGGVSAEDRGSPRRVMVQSNKLVQNFLDKMPHVTGTSSYSFQRALQVCASQAFLRIHWFHSCGQVEAKHNCKMILKP